MVLGAYQSFSVKWACRDNNVLSSLPTYCFDPLYVNYGLGIVFANERHCDYLCNPVLQYLLWSRAHNCKMNGPRLYLWSIDNWIMVLLRVMQYGITNLNKSFGISGSQLFHWIPNMQYLKAKFIGLLRRLNGMPGSYKMLNMYTCILAHIFSIPLSFSLRHTRGK